MKWVAASGALCSASASSQAEQRRGAAAKGSSQTDIHRFQIDAVDLLTCANDRH
jgi:hypothetical protein